MEKIELMGVRGFLNAERKWIRLEYYLITDDREGVNIPLYGILVFKYLFEDRTQQPEMEEAKKISDSKEFVDFVIRKLIHCLVTPLCLIEIVDDLVSEREQLFRIA